MSLLGDIFNYFFSWTQTHTSQDMYQDTDEFYGISSESINTFEKEFQRLQERKIEVLPLQKVQVDSNQFDSDLKKILIASQKQSLLENSEIGTSSNQLQISSSDTNNQQLTDNENLGFNAHEFQQDSAFMYTERETFQTKFFDTLTFEENLSKEFQSWCNNHTVSLLNQQKANYDEELGQLKQQYKNAFDHVQDRFTRLQGQYQKLKTQYKTLEGWHSNSLAKNEFISSLVETNNKLNDCFDSFNASNNNLETCKKQLLQKDFAIQKAKNDFILCEAKKDSLIQQAKDNVTLCEKDSLLKINQKNLDIQKAKANLSLCEQEVFHQQQESLRFAEDFSKAEQNFQQLEQNFQQLDQNCQLVITSQQHNSNAQLENLMEQIQNGQKQELHLVKDELVKNGLTQLDEIKMLVDFTSNQTKKVIQIVNEYRDDWQKIQLARQQNIFWKIMSNCIDWTVGLLFLSLNEQHPAWIHLDTARKYPFKSWEKKIIGFFVAVVLLVPFLWFVQSVCLKTAETSVAFSNKVYELYQKLFNKESEAQDKQKDSQKTKNKHFFKKTSTDVRGGFLQKTLPLQHFLSADSIDFNIYCMILILSFKHKIQNRNFHQSFSILKNECDRRLDLIFYESLDTNLLALQTQENRIQRVRNTRKVVFCNLFAGFLILSNFKNPSMVSRSRQNNDLVFEIRPAIERVATVQQPFLKAFPAEEQLTQLRQKPKRSNVKTDSIILRGKNRLQFKNKLRKNQVKYFHQIFSNEVFSNEIFNAHSETHTTNQKDSQVRTF